MLLVKISECVNERVGVGVGGRSNWCVCFFR